MFVEYCSFVDQFNFAEVFTTILIKNVHWILFPKIMFLVKKFKKVLQHYLMFSEVKKNVLQAKKDF